MPCAAILTGRCPLLPAAFEGNQALHHAAGSFRPNDVHVGRLRRNNVAETAYIVRTGRIEEFWNCDGFTPAVEVPLCGHANTCCRPLFCLRMKAFVGDANFFRHSPNPVV